MPARQLLSVLIIALVAASAAAADNASDEITAQLRRGGYVLFVRHPKTNEDQADVDPLHLDNIQAQRQLTDEGRDQARQLGVVLRSLRVAVALVISSKFHRAQEATKLLDLGDVTTSTDVTEGGLVVSPKEDKRRAARSKRFWRRRLLRARTLSSSATSRISKTLPARILATWPRPR